MEEAVGAGRVSLAARFWGPRDNPIACINSSPRSCISISPSAPCLVVPIATFPRGVLHAGRDHGTLPGPREAAFSQTARKKDRASDQAGEWIACAHRSPTIFRRHGARANSPLSASPPLFESRFLDFFSRVHPSVRRSSSCRSSRRWSRSGSTAATTAREIALLVLAGLLLWTLTEYWLHRKVFHWEPDHPFGRRMHFIIHGVHHDHPNDRLRLVMPPGASIPLALCSSAFLTDLRARPRLPAFAGFLAGYLIYDYTHYYLHHPSRRPPPASGCASSTCGTTSRITATATASPHRSGMSCSGTLRASERAEFAFPLLLSIPHHKCHGTV